MILLGIGRNDASAVAISMADGYAQASGTLGVVNVHTSPGLGNAMGMLYDAQKAGSPILVTTGQQAEPPQRHHDSCICPALRRGALAGMDTGSRGPLA